MPKLRLLPKIVSVVLLLLFFSTGLAYAQGIWYDPTPEEHATALQECESGEVGLECTVQAIVSGVGNSLGYGGAGDPTIAQKPGAIGFAAAMIGKLMGNLPISSHDYVQYVASKMNIAQPAYAQGTGYSVLSPLIRVWSAFRNIAYLAYVLIFIFIGFMIMFRAKLDPQTVVNVQNSLPKLVITLLLITFSYAIAGFMVDLIYLGIYILIATFDSAGLLGEPTIALNRLLTQNLFELVFKAGLWRLTANAAQSVQELISSALANWSIGKYLGSISGWLAHAVFVIALLFAMFKLFFQLGIAYIQIILQTIFAPIFILFNALPGSQSFSSWLRNFLSNILIFPAVATLFLIAAVLLGPYQPGPGKPSEDPFDITAPLIPSGTPFWMPPFIGLAGGVDAEAILQLIGFFFILFAPQMVSTLQQALKAKPLPTGGVFAPIAAGAGIVGGALGAPGRAIGGVARGVVGGYVQQKGEALGGELFPPRRR
ncbi:MAG: hypothetical protein A2900_00920 [Candidatus Chisholmbacteria bacterium RIFCSPLOWO2_01_FULL_50_28]|uniref:TrbL/VirB6 plasmid conjugal transfer protein n=1 Tax=Candidatus Chisholmbacteria bacterium RIFCSPHIGHO2_01_FULL_52_32 TaxID=1797591 RepID=A0A1G1VUH6_9BACT|nr:MAG: hypothetical protein A2786_05980 [Candidatus Chisholmbacteria bacterium RIFCSPHIGHO2_01_FULL_52_32]OGY19651.1 MAG: hypothetical protein A2900_00920 [Candidatus Chisholmbacteria bacterium RIFCSPLOWO2_01_FULL_50_28]